MVAEVTGGSVEVEVVAAVVEVAAVAAEEVEERDGRNMAATSPSHCQLLHHHIVCCHLSVSVLYHCLHLSSYFIDFIVFNILYCEHSHLLILCSICFHFGCKLNFNNSTSVFSGKELAR